MSDSLGDRIKRYESAFSQILPWRLPVILRIDGKAFHSWTASLSRPWCEPLAEGMNQAALALCEEFQGAKLAYIQSDEISFLLWPWNENESMPYFGNEINKLVSVAAGIASSSMTLSSKSIHGKYKSAVFDARSFIVPAIDVNNYFIWRQQDAERNSLLNLTQKYFSFKEMQGAKKAQMHEMLYTKGINWSDLPTEQKRGRCIIKIDECWTLDREIPIFSENRNYINNLMTVEGKPII